jgi:hypothetical protein
MAKILYLHPDRTYPTQSITHFDYEPSEECCNDNSYGMLCVKCGRCGRKFIDGVLQEGGAE